MSINDLQTEKDELDAGRKAQAVEKTYAGKKWVQKQVFESNKRTTKKQIKSNFSTEI